MITDLEEKFGLTPGEAAALLGIDRRRYWEFATGRREVPPYLEASVRAHLELSKAKAERLLRGVGK